MIFIPVYILLGTALGMFWAYQEVKHRIHYGQKECSLCRPHHSWMSGLMTVFMMSAPFTWPLGLLYRLLVVMPYHIMMKRDASQQGSAFAYKAFRNKADEAALRELAEEEKKRLEEKHLGEKQTLAEEDARNALAGRHRPEALQGWFAKIAKTVPVFKVVPPPAPQPPVIAVKGFSVPCACRTGLTTMIHPSAYPMGMSPKPPVAPGMPCSKCNGRGYVFVEKG